MYLNRLFRLFSNFFDPSFQLSMSALTQTMPGIPNYGGALRIHSSPVPEVTKPGAKETIRGIISETLRRCDMTYPTEVEKCKGFQVECMEEAVRRGYSMQGTNAILKVLIPPGAEAAFLFYPHLRDSHHELLVLIGLYFALLFYLDDVFDHNYTAISEFNDRFVTNRPQRAKVLDHFATLILEMSYFYSGASANLVVSGSLNFVTGTLVEHETKTATLNPYAQGFPAFLKTLVSANMVLCVFAFPPSTPVKDYIQALPEMVIFTNNFSDVLSFYKEDLEGENFNRISHLARSRGASKLEVLRTLSEETSCAYERIIHILSACPAGPQTTKDFFYGALAIHASASRYRFKELGF
ncbi:hypothetical protein Hypma_001990 [Hypsizygus marmoreus]|uniref:Terpenoid synthase n=1 Tax=Hypsizygus marmoreus TaxID=39966 RepID=A0A369J5M5_HYPMA|nr:hypothetical protein Hypma_001990 [Hypsizygus marmoreus]